MTPNLRVLILEDDEDMSEMLADHVRSLGCDVMVGRTGREGIEFGALFLPELVLADLGLPDMNGCDVVWILRDLPALAKTMFVAMTGDSDLEKTRRAGFHVHAIKPLSWEAIGRFVQRRKESSAFTRDIKRARDFLDETSWARSPRLGVP